MAANIEKDLHSVYIDNELPPAYLDKYESLVKSDSTCAAELEKMKTLHTVLQEDSRDIQLDDAFLEASFERLQTKMRYRKTMAQTENAQPKIYQFAKWGGAIVAAAAVFAMVFTPAYLRTASAGKHTEISAIKNTKLKPIAQNDIAVDGNIDRTMLSSIAVNDSAAIQGATVTSMAASPRNASRSQTIALNDSLTSIDVFRPASASADNGLSIRISISPIHDVRGEEELIIPMPTIAQPAAHR